MAGDEEIFHSISPRDFVDFLHAAKEHLETDWTSIRLLEVGEEPYILVEGRTAWQVGFFGESTERPGSYHGYTFMAGYAGVTDTAQHANNWNQITRFCRSYADSEKTVIESDNSIIGGIGMGYLAESVIRWLFLMNEFEEHYLARVYKEIPDTYLVALNRVSRDET